MFTRLSTNSVIKHACLVALMLVFATHAKAQDFSNRGTDFWTGYGPHEKISSGTSDMTLYFTSDDTATVTIYIGNTLFQTLSLPANSITASNNIPEAGATDARLQNESVYVNKGIYIHSTSPVVAYAQIWGSKVTATSILFPVKTLGRKYTSLNYTQISNTSGMRSYLFVVATENATTVEVKPTATTSAGLAAGVWTSRTLNRGDVWLIKGGTDATDLTGTQVRSVSSAGSTCKPIAVFSGSQKISVTCTTSSASGDNFFQQCFPISAWGRFFVSAPTAGLNYSNNVYRVMINPDSLSTVVKVNGVTLPGAVPGLSPAITPLTLGATINRTNNLYYEFVTGAPIKIESNSPVMVAQYISNKTNCGNNFSSIGDPDMIYLSPVEQTVDSIIVSPVPTENNDATNYLNINMKTVDVPNFTIRNQANAVVPATFVPNPADPAYSYAQVSLAAGYSNTVYYKLKTTTGGFNAIAYGYATSESYAYNAGTNVRNLNHYLTSANPLANNDNTPVCKGTPTQVSVTLPYIPTSLTFDFFNNPNITPNASVTVSNPPVDSSYILNGTPLYVFHLSGLYTFNTTGLVPVHVSATNPLGDGCNGVEELNFEFNVVGGPHANFSWNFSGCASNPVSFLNLSTDTVHSISNWQWDFGNASGTSILASPSYTYDAGGSYNVHLNVVNDQGCVDDTTRVFTINNSPSANFTFTGTSCVGNTITFNDQSSILNGTISHWYWDYGDGVRDTFLVSTQPTHIFTAAGNYTVTLIVDNANGCRSTHTETVVVGNRPVPNFDLPGNVCLPGGSALFVNTSTVAGGGNMVYSWDFGDASPSSNQTSPSHIYTSTGPFSVTLTASLGTCSKDTVKVFNTLYQNPVASFNMNASNCLNTTTSFTSNSTSSNSIINQWDWDFGDGFQGSNANTTHTYLTAGTYTVTLQVTNDKGCADDTVRTIVVNPLPQASFTVSSPLCASQAVTFTDQSVPNAGVITEWQWNFGDGTTVIRTDANPLTHTYAAAGNYTVTLIVKTDLGCVSVAFTQNVIIHEMPSPEFTYPVSNCSPGSITFTNNTTIADGTLSQMTYNWNFGDNSNSQLSAPTHSYLAGGSYNVVLTATSNNGCIKTVAHTIPVYSLPSAAFTVNNNGNVCSNLPLSITNTSSVTGFGAITSVSVYWDYLNNVTDITTDNQPQVNEIYTHQYAVFGAPLIKVYHVLIRVYNSNGCSTDYSMDIDVHAAPSVMFNNIPGICQESPAITLTAGYNSTSLGGTGVYSGPGISNVNLFNPEVAGAGTVPLTYTFTGNNGCVASGSTSVTVYPTPSLNLGPDRSVLEGNSIVLSPITISGSGLTYTWTPATYLSNSTIVNPLCTPSNDIVYALQIQSDKGCKNEDDIFVKVIKDFIVPNTFSPNGDGINDTWRIENLIYYPNHKLEIYNRSGQVMFRSTQYNGEWDGTYKGKSLPSGTYYYIIDLGGVRAPKKGYVTLIR